MTALGDDGRTVVCQLDIHRRPENTVGRDNVTLPKGMNHPIDQGSGMFRPGSVSQRRATPSFHISEQGELAHDQNLAIDIYQ